VIFFQEHRLVQVFLNLVLDGVLVFSRTRTLIQGTMRTRAENTPIIVRHNHSGQQLAATQNALTEPFKIMGLEFVKPSERLP
jgi:hypothetical protein